MRFRIGRSFGTGTPLALVHRLNPRDGYRVPLRDEVGVETLRRRHLCGPWVRVAEEGGHSPYREV